MTLNRNETIEEINFINLFETKVRFVCSSCKKIKQNQITRLVNIGKYVFIHLPTEIIKKNKTIKYKTKIVNIEEDLEISGNKFILKSAVQYLKNTNKQLNSKGHFICFFKDFLNGNWLRISDKNCDITETLPIGLENIYILLLENIN